MNLGGRIKAEREARQWTQAQLAREAGLPQKNGQQAVQALEDRDSQRSVHAGALCQALGLSLEYALYGTEPKYKGSASSTVTRLRQSVAARVLPDEGVANVTAVPMSSRMLPILTYAQAGEPRDEWVDDFAPGAADDYKQVDAEMAGKLGPYAFALYVEGDSMLPDFKQGDLVIIDPDASIRPGDFVVAKVQGKSRATLKKYRDRGVDEQGREQFDL